MIVLAETKDTVMLPNDAEVDPFKQQVLIQVMLIANPSCDMFSKVVRSNLSIQIQPLDDRMVQTVSIAGYPHKVVSSVFRLDHALILRVINPYYVASSMHSSCVHHIQK